MIKTHKICIFTLEKVSLLNVCVCVCGVKIYINIFYQTLGPSASL